MAWSGRPLLPSRGASQGPADPYKVLGVTPQTEDRELKAKFFKLARECHPDLHPNDPKANARFAELTVAYESIKDAEARSSLKWKRMMSDDSSQQEDSKRGAPRADEEEESDSDFDSDYDEEDQPVKEKPTK
ncbi:MAG: J domain-containing protein, partial [archaeon]|nr:J domain-containing protein [archaeon]